MRIAFVTFEYPPFIIGGAGIHAKKITLELARRGHQIVVFTPAANKSFPEDDYNENIEVIRIPVHQKIPFKALQFWFRLPKEIERIEKERAFDIIHFNGISYWFLKRRIVDAPHIVTIHHLVSDSAISTGESFISRFKNISGETGFCLSYIEKRCIRSADRIIAVSNFTRDRIVLTYHLDPSDINVIYNGVDECGLPFFRNELDAIKKRYHIKNKPIILFVGRIDDPRKGLNNLIESFKLVLENIDAQLLVVGSGDQKRAREIAGPASDNVIFIGYVDEVTLKKCYALCDVYVCPSRLEGFGLTILEAFAAGKPVVAMNVGAISELFHDRKNGILIEKDDNSAMARAIFHYVKNPSPYERIDRTNPKTFDKKFRWDTNAMYLEKVYNNMRNL